MEELKRSRYLFLRLQDRELIDIGRLLRGSLSLETLPRLEAISILERRLLPITVPDVELLLRVPADRWVPAGEVLAEAGLPEERLEWLLDHGLLLEKPSEGRRREMAAMERRLAELAWHPNAALFHFLDPSSRGAEPGRGPTGGQPGATTSEEAFSSMVERFGPPPSAFHERSSSGSSLPLSRPRGEGQLYRTLLERRTCRAFDSELPLAGESLATLLYYSFGCQATTRLADEVLALRRCSPSGGSLHPVEAYPIVANVEGIEPGCYHYNGERHALDLLHPLDREAIGDLLYELSAGQSYTRDVHVLLLLTARFERNFWKYRDLARTYGVILMDAAHLSQNLYLVATELGLGAFFSGAIAGERIEELLDLDPIAEGAVAIFGCGRPAAEPSPIDLVRKPFGR